MQPTKSRNASQASASTIERRGGLGDLERRALSHLAALERPTIAVDDLLAMSANRASANLILSRLSRKGWLRRLQRGVYSVVPLSSQSPQPVVEDPLALASRLFSPCYISGWTAAQHWDLTEQIFNSVVVYTAKAQRKSQQSVGGVTYLLRRVRRETIFGTSRLWSGTVPIEIADIHRTVIDVLDNPAMGGGGRQVLDIVRNYWRKTQADRELLLAMALKLRRGTVFKRLGFTAEQFGHPSAAWLEECARHLSAGISLLDPEGPNRGRIVSRWRLKINLPIEATP